MSFGTFFELGGRGAMESLARTGLDYVIIDTEHGCFSEESTAEYILSAEKGGLLVLSGAFMAADPAEAGDVYTVSLDGFPSLTMKFE